jgi:hypothetical protein
VVRAVVVAVVSVVGSATAHAQPRLEQWNAGFAQGNLNMALPAASKAGDLIVVAASGESLSCTVLDNAGNTYLPTGPPINGAGSLSTFNQQLFYAQNIIALPGPLQLTGQCTTAELRVFEYSGVSRSSALDQSAGATGVDSFADSGFVTPSAAGERVFGAVLSINLVHYAGDGFTDEFEFHGDMIEDLVDPAQAPIAATANADPPWIAQVATFRADSSFDAGPAIEVFSDGGIGGPFTALQWNGVQSSVGIAALPLVASPTPGSVIVVCLASSDFTAGVTDDSGEQYVLVSSVAGTGALAGMQVSLFYALNTAPSTSRNVTINSIGSGVTSIQVAEYFGIDQVTPVDLADGTAGSAGSMTLSQSLTTSSADELIVGCGVTSGQVTGAGPASNVRHVLTSSVMVDGFASVAGDTTVSVMSNDPSWILLAGAFHRLGFDAGTVFPDGGAPDGGAADAGAMDGGELDAGAQDAGARDGGASGPRATSVSCGCQAAPANWLALLAALLTCRRVSSRRR